jgi:hypothetical protein
MAVTQASRNRHIAMVASSFLVACGSSCSQSLPVQTQPAPSVHNQLVLPPVVYGYYQGRQMSESDDPCGVPTPLRRAVQDQLTARYEVVLPALSAGRGAAPLLKIEIMDVVTVSAGGPTIVVIQAVLERPGRRTVQFTGERQMQTRYRDITAETTECSAMETVIHGLGVDIAKWMLKPVNGVFLVNGE